MASHYVTSASDFDQAVRSLHADTAMIVSAHPGKVRGDAHLIFEDVCDLIEHLGKVEGIRLRDRTKVKEAMLVLEFLHARSAEDLTRFAKEIIDQPMAAE